MLDLCCEHIIKEIRKASSLSIMPDNTETQKHLFLFFCRNQIYDMREMLMLKSKENKNCPIGLCQPIK